MTESFARQPPAFQQYYFHGCLRIRAALCRAGAGLSAAAGALQRLQALCECWAAAGGALRADDRPDAAALQALADDAAPADADKALAALAALEAKPELGGEAVALAALRRLLRRAADVAAATLAALPAHPPHAPHPPHPSHPSHPPHPPHQSHHGHG